MESYSAFEDPWGLFPSTLEQSLRDAGIKHVVVTGLGTLFLNLHFCQLLDFVVYLTLLLTLTYDGSGGLLCPKNMHGCG